MKKSFAAFLLLVLVLCVACIASAEKNGWVKEGSYLFYYKNDVKVTGTQTIDGNIYHFTEEGHLEGNNQIQNGYFIDDNNMIVTGWKTIDDKKYYFDPETGRPFFDGVHEIEGIKYLFSNGHLLVNDWTIRYEYGDNEGKILVGYHTIEGAKYLFDENGRSLSGFYEIDGNIHYFRDFHFKCEESLGWMEINNDLYYFDPNTGIMQTTGRTIDGTDYTFGKDGKLIHSSTVLIKDIRGDWRGYDENNQVLKGWQTINGSKYYFRYAELPKNYHVYIANVGECGIDSNSYYFDENGRLQTNYLYVNEVEGHKYISYFGSDGKGVTEWQTIDGEKYFFDKNSHDALIGMHGVYDDNGYVIYYFDEDGKMKTNCLYKDEKDNKLFYFGSDGKGVTGWQTIDGEKYFFDSFFHALIGYHGVYDDNGYDMYYFDEDGKMKTNYWYKNEIDNHLYYFGSDGKGVNGWQTIDGEKYFFRTYAVTGPQLVTSTEDQYATEYYFDEDGRMQRNFLVKTKINSWNDDRLAYFYYGADGRREKGWKTIDGDTYYFNEFNGALTGTAKIGGIEYYFSDEGKLIPNTGDINSDGFVDGRDVIHFMKWLAEEDDIKIAENAADVNHDGKTDEKDLLVLMQYLGGQIEKLP